MMTKNANGNYVLHVEFSADELDLAMACCSNAFAQVITEKTRAENACNRVCPCCEDEDDNDDIDPEDAYDAGYDDGYDAAIAEMREWLDD